MQPVVPLASAATDRLGEGRLDHYGRAARGFQGRAEGAARGSTVRAPAAPPQQQGVGALASTFELLGLHRLNVESRIRATQHEAEVRARPPPSRVAALLRRARPRLRPDMRALRSSWSACTCAQGVFHYVVERSVGIVRISDRVKCLVERCAPRPPSPPPFPVTPTLSSRTPGC